MTVKSVVSRVLAGLAVLACLYVGPARAEPVNTGNVVGELHSSRAAVAPGERFTILLRQQIREGWHTYWRNPGDSGEATELTWTAPAGFEVGALQWPTPDLAPFANIINFGYHGEVLYPIEVTAPANAPVGQNATFSANAYWLVCADICVPEQGVLTLSVPIAAQGRDDPEWAPRAQQAIASLPRRESGVSAAITAGAPARLSIAVPSLGEIRNPHFFTYERDVMAHSEPQHPRVGNAGLSFDIPAGVATNLGQAPLAGVVTFEQNQGGQWTRRAIEIEAAPGAEIANTNARAAEITDDFPLADLERAGVGAATPAAPVTFAALMVALGLAFLGGLVLNVMPCVLPVLSIKALNLAGGAHRGEAKREGVFFFVGVMVTFLVLAGVLIALQAGGAAVGWGFQLQEPWFVGGLAVLFFLIGLNLLGMFEIGGSVQNLGQGLTARGGDFGAFFTGALAVVAATPCTAWFMAGAIGFAATAPWYIALLVFAVLGIGFAAPFTLLAFIPALQKRIPKPGPWMERVKQLLAFPMFGTAVWLTGVLTGQTGARGVLTLLTVATLFAFLIWSLRSAKGWRLRAGALALLVIAAGTFAWFMRPSALTVEAWTPERVAALQAENRPIFVNFTADWCVTCQVNDHVALSSERVARAFNDRNVVYLKGDWTNRDAAIAAELAEHGRAGVPLYLYYPANGGPPQVLPQILTEGLVLDVLAGGAS